MPAASAIRASLRLSGQLPDQRSGTRVTARPDEQLAPNSPILNLLALCIAMRSWRDGAGASTVPPESSTWPVVNQASPWGLDFEWRPLLPRTRATVRIAKSKTAFNRDAHDPLLDRARNVGGCGDGDRRRPRAAGSLPQPLDQDRRALPGRWPLRRPRAHDRPEN